MVKKNIIILRGLAMLIDYAILSAHFFPITRLVKGTWMMFSEDHLWGGIFDPICAVFLVIIIAYNILLEGLWSRTPGKALLRLRITDVKTGGKITMKQAVVRFLGRFVDGIAANLVGVFIMISNPLCQRMGDKWAHTSVVRNKG